MMSGDKKELLEITNVITDEDYDNEKYLLVRLSRHKDYKMPISLKPFTNIYIGKKVGTSCEAAGNELTTFV